MKLSRKILILLITLFLLTSCEGLKVLAIHNISDHEAKVTVRPALDYSDKAQKYNYQNNQTSDSSVVVLRPDSSMTIQSTFTWMMFNVKIKESELRLDHLKIETPTDTAIADSRSEIINLIYSKRKGRIRGVGRNFATIKIDNDK